jgi:hypothetical protein
MELDQGSNYPSSLDLPKDIPQVKPVVYSVKEGDNVGFGSDSSNVEESKHERFLQTPTSWKKQQRLLHLELPGTVGSLLGCRR